MRARSESGQPRLVVGLDLGMTTGWAILSADAEGRVRHHASGRWRLRHGEHPGELPAAFVARLDALLASHAVHAVAVEDVRRHVGTRAAHVYGGLRMLVELVSGQRGPAVLPIGVGQVKRRVTGQGNASKEQMRVAALELFGVPPEDDNHADALAVALCGVDVAARWHA